MARRYADVSAPTVLIAGARWSPLSAEMLDCAESGGIDVGANRFTWTGTVWLTGLSGAGKSTLARALCARLLAMGKLAYVLDGDAIRQGLSADLGFAQTDRAEHVRRVAEVAKMMADAGVVAIVAVISPSRIEREKARGIISSDRFIEVYVNASLRTCEERDVKGLYGRARRGEIKEFTGISSAYEAPQSPELELRSDVNGFSECTDRLLAEVLRRRGKASQHNSVSVWPKSGLVRSI